MNNNCDVFSSSTNTMAVQLPKAMASSLNSGDSFLLVTPTNVFLWNGNGSNEVERAVGLDVASQLAATYNSQAGRAVISVEEGSEPNEFWTALGGKQEYPHFKDVEVYKLLVFFSMQAVEEYYDIPFEYIEGNSRCSPVQRLYKCRRIQS